MTNLVSRVGMKAKIWQKEKVIITVFYCIVRHITILSKEGSSVSKEKAENIRYN